MDEVLRKKVSLTQSRGEEGKGIWDSLFLLILLPVSLSSLCVGVYPAVAGVILFLLQTAEVLPNANT